MARFGSAKAHGDRRLRTSLASDGQPGAGARRALKFAKPERELDVRNVLQGESGLRAADGSRDAGPRQRVAEADEVEQFVRDDAGIAQRGFAAKAHRPVDRVAGVPPGDEGVSLGGLRAD